MEATVIKAIIFDLGGVLIDWNPHYLYKKLFADEQEMLHFLANVANMDWNEEQDMGRPLNEGTDWLVKKHPDHEENIRAYYGRWEEMLGETIPGMVELFEQIKAGGRYHLYALSNWSAETFETAKRRFPFLNDFDGLVISGVEKTRKPFPEFYRLLLQRYNLQAAECLFIDDNERNVVGAEAVGLPAIHFTNAVMLKEDLICRGLI